MNSSASVAQLIDAASDPYRAAGRFAYHWARNKLRQDPVFVQILLRGLLCNRNRILDLGCGQGLLAAWLMAAARLCARQQWPRDWPAAPQPQSIRGIELMPAEVVRARRALGASAEFVSGDIRSVPFGAADAVVILDVLHYMDVAAQQQVLRRVRQALAPNGVLLLRIGNADGGWRFRFSVWVDQLVMLVRGHGLVRLRTHSLTGWQQTLEQCGFRSDPLPMSDGTLFANVLLVAHAT